SKRQHSPGNEDEAHRGPCSSAVSTSGFLEEEDDDSDLPSPAKQAAKRPKDAKGKAVAKPPSHSSSAQVSRATTLTLSMRFLSATPTGDDIPLFFGQADTRNPLTLVGEVEGGDKDGEEACNALWTLAEWARFRYKTPLGATMEEGLLDAITDPEIL